MPPHYHDSWAIRLGLEQLSSLLHTLALVFVRSVSRETLEYLGRFPETSAKSQTAGFLVFREDGMAISELDDVPKPKSVTIFIASVGSSGPPLDRQARRLCHSDHLPLSGSGGDDSEKGFRYARTRGEV